jgi:hypothetical protein
MSARFWFAAVVAAGPLVVSAAYADEPKFDYGNYADVKGVTKPEWFASAEGGLVVTTGTTDSTTATGGFKVSRKEGNNKLGLEASGTYAKTGTLVLDDLNGNGMIDNTSELVERDQITAETLASKARYDRFLTPDNSLFVAALAGRDLPAGKTATFGGQFGYSRQLYKSKTSTTTGEIGYDFSREDLTVGAPLSVHSIRAFLGHKAQLMAGATLDASIEALTNLNRENLPTTNPDGTPIDGGPFLDTRVNLRLAISAKVSSSIAFTTSIESHFDNRPGPLTLPSGSAPFAMGFVPPAAEVETIMKVSLIYTFLGAAAPKK